LPVGGIVDVVSEIERLDEIESERHERHEKDERGKRQCRRPHDQRFLAHAACQQDHGAHLLNDESVRHLLAGTANAPHIVRRKTASPLQCLANARYLSLYTSAHALMLTFARSATQFPPCGHATIKGDTDNRGIL